MVARVRRQAEPEVLRAEDAWAPGAREARAVVAVAGVVDVRGLPAAVARLTRERPFATDVGLAVLLAALTVPGGLQVDYDGVDRGGTLPLLLAVVASLALALRRHAPLAVLAVTLLCADAAELLGGQSDGGGLAALVAVYTVAAWCDSRRALLGLAVALVSAVLVTALLPGVRDPVDDVPVVLLLLAVALAHVVPWLVGRVVRIRRAYTLELEERARRLEHEREQRAERAVLDERVRIARELHDVVGHHLSVVAVQGAVARRALDRSGDVRTAASALQVVEETTRAALVELRHVVGVLRAERPAQDDPAGSPPPGTGDPGPPAVVVPAPQPDLDRLDDLLEAARGRGLDVVRTEAGSPRPLPAGTALAAYRVVQESLTNAARHARGAQVRVRLAWRPDALAVEVVDSGAGACASTGAGGPGALGDDGAPAGAHGLAGMRERVASLGGRLVAGPSPTGSGWEVRAELPLDGSTR